MGNCGRRRNSAFRKAEETRQAQIRDARDTAVENNNRFASVLIQLFEEVLEEENLEAALAGSLEILVRALRSEAGTIWMLDRETNALVPMFHIGPLDLSNFRMKPCDNIESGVTRNGKSILLNDRQAGGESGGTILEDLGYPVRNMICVPLNNLQEVIGCLQVVNKKDGLSFEEGDLKL